MNDEKLKRLEEILKRNELEVGMSQGADDIRFLFAEIGKLREELAEKTEALKDLSERRYASECWKKPTDGEVKIADAVRYIAREVLAKWDRTRKE